MSDGLRCPLLCDGVLIWDAPTNVIRCSECEATWHPSEEKS
jgi:hypothetical protein